MFCKYCGKEIRDYETLCPYCKKELDYSNENGKDWGVTALLCIFFGVWGLHRFYTGNIVRGILYILTLGGVGGILPFWDLMLLLTNKYKDCYGNKLINYDKTIRNYPIILMIIFIIFIIFAIFVLFFFNIGCTYNII